MLFAKLSHRSALRCTLPCIHSVHPRLYLPSSTTVKPNSLFAISNSRFYNIYSVLFSLLVQALSVQPKHNLKFNQKHFYLDASTINFNLNLFCRMGFRKKSAVSPHAPFSADDPKNNSEETNKLIRLQTIR